MKKSMSLKAARHKQIDDELRHRQKGVIEFILGVLADVLDGTDIDSGRRNRIKQYNLQISISNNMHSDIDMGKHVDEKDNNRWK